MRKVVMRSSKTGFTVTEAIEHFLRQCMARNLTDGTIGIYKTRLRVFQEFLNDDAMFVSSVSKNTVDDFTIFLKESGNRNDVTVTSYLRDLRVFLYSCMEGEYLPAFKIKLPRVDKPLKETYTDNELQILLKKSYVGKRWKN